ncbi:MAG: hypothetical protein K6A41_08245 [Bacteroidales bacterium]|nr:hypothetical protein [Bacteroidales bacterium]
MTTFPLMSKGSHIFFTASIDGEPVEIMLESGLPAFLIEEKFYEQHLKKTDIPFEPSQAKINLFHDSYSILLRANGKINIGESVYEGPIYILKDFNDLRLPIQYLKDAKTNKAVVEIDLPEKRMSIGEDGIESTHYQKFKFSYNEKGMPTIRTVLLLTTARGEAKLKGDFILDFGNPMFLFMMRQHKSLEKAVKKGDVELKDAYNNEGVLVAQGIYAVKLSLAGRDYSDIPIGVTDKMETINQLGLLGIPFFSTPVVFDFDKKVLRVYEN